MMTDRLNKTSICSVVFLDIIDHSRKSVHDQIEDKSLFNGLINEAIKNVAQNDRIIIDTGDGAAIALMGEPEDALFTALIIRDGIVEHNTNSASHMAVRIGINLGSVRVVNDINNRPNIIGDGINVAERIMSFAGENQILVSRSYYEVTARLTKEITDMFLYSGVKQDKHVREHEVYSIVPKENSVHSAIASARKPTLQAAVETQKKAQSTSKTVTFTLPVFSFHGLQQKVTGLFHQVALKTRLAQKSMSLKTNNYWQAFIHRSAITRNPSKVYWLALLMLCTLVILTIWLGVASDAQNGENAQLAEKSTLPSGSEPTAQTQASNQNAFEKTTSGQGPSVIENAASRKLSTLEVNSATVSTQPNTKQTSTLQTQPSAQPAQIANPNISRDKVKKDNTRNLQPPKIATTADIAPIVVREAPTREAAMPVTSLPAVNKIVCTQAQIAMHQCK